MSAVEAVPFTPEELREKLRRRLQSNADGVLENLAAEHGVSLIEAIEMLPESARTILPGSLFEEAMTEAAGWGEVLFIVHTVNIVLECVGKVPQGAFGRGYFNIHADDSPIGGHIKADRCDRIVFLRRPFMGRESYSLQFFDGDGAAMFKIFVRRGPDRQLLREQIAKVEASRQRLSEAAGRAFVGD
jgi:putative heme utilization carrier protein HutX